MARYSVKEQEESQPKNYNGQKRIPTANSNHRSIKCGQLVSSHSTPPILASSPEPLYRSGLGLDIFLINSRLDSGGQILVWRGNLFFLISRQLLIRRSLIIVTITHPKEDDGLPEEHANCAGSHAKCNTDQDRDEGNLDGDPHDMSHAAEEALGVPLVMMMRVGTTIHWRGLVVVAGKFHRSIWATVGSAVMLVAHHTHDAVEAFDAEAFDLVGSGLGSRLDTSNAAQELGHDTTHHVVTFSVRSVFVLSDGSDGVEGDL